MDTVGDSVYNSSPYDLITLSLNGCETNTRKK